MFIHKFLPIINLRQVKSFITLCVIRPGLGMRNNLWLLIQSHKRLVSLGRILLFQCSGEEEETPLLHYLSIF